MFFSGLTVVLALSGMLLVPTTIFRGLAGGAIIVVLVSVAASMTLLPAVLNLLGTPAKRVGSDWLDWPWMSRTANALSLLGMIVVASVVATIASAVGAPNGLVAVAGLIGFVAAAVGLTRWLRRDASWLSRRIRHEQIEQGRPGGFWDRASRAVMARPVISFAALRELPDRPVAPLLVPGAPRGRRSRDQAGAVRHHDAPGRRPDQAGVPGARRVLPEGGGERARAGRDPRQPGRSAGASRGSRR